MFNAKIQFKQIVSQLAERSLPIPEVSGSNSVIGKILCRTCLLSMVEKTIIKEKETDNGPFGQKTDRV